MWLWAKFQALTTVLTRWCSHITKCPFSFTVLTGGTIDRHLYENYSVPRFSGNKTVRIIQWTGLNSIKTPKMKAIYRPRNPCRQLITLAWTWNSLFYKASNRTPTSFDYNLRKPSSDDKGSISLLSGAQISDDSSTNLNFGEAFSARRLPLKVKVETRQKPNESYSFSKTKAANWSSNFEKGENDGMHCYLEFSD